MCLFPRLEIYSFGEGFEVSWHRVSPGHMRSFLEQSSHEEQASIRAPEHALGLVTGDVPLYSLTTIICFQVRFRDEKRFLLFNDGPITVWRRAGQKYVAPYIRGTVKSGANGLALYRKQPG